MRLRNRTIEQHMSRLYRMKYKADRRTMAHRHMRRSVVSAGGTGGLLTDITWKVGKLEVICIHGGSRFPVSAMCVLAGHLPRGEYDVCILHAKTLITLKD